MTRPNAVAIVVTCYNLGRTIAEAVESARHQTLPPVEVVVVDDGSDEPQTRRALADLEAAGIRVIHTANRGTSAARNTGIALTSAPLVVVLDGDDLLDPSYLAQATARLSGPPAVDYVSCAMRGFGATSYEWRPPDPALPESVIRGVVHASTLFRREVWEAVGGFDEALAGFEVLDFWTLVLEHGFRGAVLDEPLLHYRVRGNSQYHSMITRGPHLACMERFYERHWHTVRANAEAFFLGKEAFLLEQFRHQRHVVGQAAAVRADIARLRAELDRAERELRALGAPTVDMGELRRTTPISARWGVERGQPVDRHYIESFLDAHRHDIRGRVLEVKDSGYTRLFGGDRVSCADVLDIDALNDQATIHANLEKADAIGDDTYDAFILTQTLPLIFDVAAALREAIRILKPGGVLLCTVPAAGRLSHEDRGPDGDYWRFTEAGLRRLFAGVVPADAFDVTGYGNVLAGSAFLYGLAAHELTPDELQASDPFLPLVYCVRAVKPPATSRSGRVADGPLPPGGAGVGPRGAAVIDAPSGRTRHRGTLAPRAVILAYHRVGACRGLDRLELPPEAFRAHVRYLQTACQPMSLRELAAASVERRLPPRAVALTFDDGYADFLTDVAPILGDAALPATLFVTGGPDTAGTEFYWDLLRRVFAPDVALPPELRLPSLAAVQGAATITAADRAGVRKRLSDELYSLSSESRDALAADLVAWSGLEAQPRGARRLDAEEIRRLARLPGITIGAHSAHHLSLPLHGEETQRQELAANREWLEALTGGRVDEFSYPYGERDAVTVRAVREAGFRVAVTVDERAVGDGWPRLLLPRCEAVERDPGAFAAWMDSLFTTR